MFRNIKITTADNSMNNAKIIKTLQALFLELSAAKNWNLQS